MKIYITIFVTSLLVVVLWFCNLWYAPKHYPAVDEKGNPKPAAIENPGIFGDMFGGLNALFTGLSLGGVAIALIAQAEQQRRQAEDARDAEERQRKSDEFQARTAAFQEATAAIQERAAKFQAMQAEALSGLYALFGVQNRREYLQHLVTTKTDEIQRQNAQKLKTYTRGTKEEVQHNAAVQRIADLEREIAAHRAELEQLGGNP